MTRSVNQPRAKYCPHCGKPTIAVSSSGRERDICEACGFVQYALFGVGVGALVFRDESVLLVERGIPPIGIWTIPSGFMEQEDDLCTAVKRETWEEANLEIVPQGIVIVRNRVDQNRNDMYVVLLCEVTDEQEPIPDGIESLQARFVHPQEFDQINISIFTRWVVEYYLEHKPTPMEMMTVPEYRRDAVIFGSL